MKFIVKYQVELIISFILIASYFVLRLPNLTLQPIFADEAIYIRWAQVMKAEPTLRFLPLSDGKTPLYMWLLMPMFKVFTDPLFAGRLLSVISGFFTLMGVFFLSKKVFNLKVALWASLLYIITPYVVFFDRMALVDSMLSAFTIWSLYFALWLMESQRLDIAMILGYLLGGAILTKTPATTSILILPVSLLALGKKNSQKYPYLTALLLLGVSIMIALIMYNLLRLGPNFHLLSSRNSDYIFSPLELKDRPLDPFIPHFHDISDWFPKLFSWPILILGLIGVAKLFWVKDRRGWVILFWALIPLLLEMTFLRTFTARYLLTFAPAFLIFASFGLTQILSKFKSKNILKIFIALIIILPLALKFDFQLIKNPPPLNLPKEERRGYFEEWTAGYGLKDIANYLIAQKKNGSVVVGTAGFFGTLPDGLQIYMDKSDIAIVGSSATISAQIRTSAKDHLIYFVGNKNDLEGKIKDVKLILEYPKAKPQDNTKQDSTALYQVLAN